MLGLWGVGLLAVLVGLPWGLDTMAWGLAALVLSAWVAYRELHPRDRLTLEWSAQGWHGFFVADGVAPDPQPCTTQVVLDLQRCMLVRVQGIPGGVRWLWCQPQDAGQWHWLRCALFAARQP